jgi:hypothetical protein
MSPVSSAAVAAVVLSNVFTVTTAGLVYTEMTKEELIEKFIASDAEIDITNIKASPIYDKCTRYFTGGHTMGYAWENDVMDGTLTDTYLLPEEGILLSSGNPLDFESNDSDQQTTKWYTPDNNYFDLDLYKQMTNAASVFDACWISFDFKCTTEAYVPKITFDYFFGSEEYYEYVDSPFNDAFALLLNDVNIAKLPTTESDTNIVSINNVNYHMNTEYFHGNGKWHVVLLLIFNFVCIVIFFLSLAH